MTLVDPGVRRVASDLEIFGVAPGRRLSPVHPGPGLPQSWSRRAGGAASESVAAGLAARGLRRGRRVSHQHGHVSEAPQLWADRPVGPTTIILCMFGNAKGHFTGHCDGLGGRFDQLEISWFENLSPSQSGKNL